jgi:hypothetical protein
MWLHKKLRRRLGSKFQDVVRHNKIVLKQECFWTKKKSRCVVFNEDAFHEFGVRFKTSAAPVLPAGFTVLNPCDIYLWMAVNKRLQIKSSYN